MQNDSSTENTKTTTATTITENGKEDSPIGLQKDGRVEFYAGRCDLQQLLLVFLLFELDSTAFYDAGIADVVIANAQH